MRTAICTAPQPAEASTTPVSYTHLDVYKRQALWMAAGFRNHGYAGTAVDSAVESGCPRGRAGPRGDPVRERFSQHPASSTQHSRPAPLAAPVEPHCGECAQPVSYTHLDVYKRQDIYLARTICNCRCRSASCYSRPERHRFPSRWCGAATNTTSSSPRAKRSPTKSSPA